MRGSISPLAMSLALGGAMSLSMSMSACSTEPELGAAAGDDGTGTGTGAGGGGSGKKGAGFSYSVPDGGATGSASAGTGAGAGAGAGTASGESHCGLQRFELEKVPPEILLVFDRSGSMNSNVPGTSNTRWVETTAALGDVLGRTNATVHWGLKLFPMGRNCEVMTGVEVPVSPGNSAAVNLAITNNKPGSVSGTPTAIAVQQATAYLRTRATRNPKYMVLATDGEPTCNDNSVGEMAIGAIMQARAAGFGTFVIGIATAGTGADGTLNAMAIVGGQARTGTTKYYPVANRDELVSALGQITNQVSSCVFPLEKQPPSPDDVAVKVDGARLPRDAAQANGWNYGPGMRSIEIHGPVCEQLKTGAVRNVSIVFGCPGLVID